MAGLRSAKNGALASMGRGDGELEESVRSMRQDIDFLKVEVQRSREEAQVFRNEFRLGFKAMGIEFEKSAL